MSEGEEQGRFAQKLGQLLRTQYGHVPGPLHEFVLASSTSRSCLHRLNLRQQAPNSCSFTMDMAPS